MNYLFFNSNFNNILGVITILAIILGVLIFRNKFQRQGALFLYRTKLGIKLIEKIGKHSTLVKTYGYIGMIIGLFLLLFGIYNIIIYYSNLSLVRAAHISAVELALPFYIPGVSIGVPILYWLIALAVTIIPHEFSHGIVARAHRLKIKNTGFGFFAFIPLAFVEIDEKKMYKSKLSTQLSILSAGSFANIIIGAIALILYIAIAFFMLKANLVQFSPVVLNVSSIKNTSAYFAGIPYNHTVPVSLFDNKTIVDNSIFIPFLGEVSPTIEGNKEVYNFGIFSFSIPFNSSRYISLLQVLEILKDANSSVYLYSLGKTYVISPNSNISFNGSEVHYGVKLFAQYQSTQPYSIIPLISFNAFPNSSLYSQILFWFSGLFLWIFIFGFGVGVINMLPVFFITDGSNVIYSLAKSITKNDKKARKISYAINLIVTFILLASVVFVI